MDVGTVCEPVRSCLLSCKGLHFVTTNYIMTCYISKCIFTSGKIKPINKQPWWKKKNPEKVEKKEIPGFQIFLFQKVLN